MPWGTCPRCGRPVHYTDEGPAIPEGEAVRIRTFGPCGCGWSVRTEEKVVEETPEDGPVPAAVEGAVR